MERFGQPAGRRKWTWGLVASSAIWGAGTALGVQLVPDAQPSPDTSPVQALLPPSTDLSAPGEPDCLYVHILARNLAVYAWLLCGLVSGGLTTLGVLFFNGVLLGQTTAAAIGMGMSPGRLAWLLLPHGIPEVGTFLIAGAMGLRGAKLLVHWMTGMGDPHALRGLWAPARVGCLALVAAAAIEVGVTVPLADWATRR